MEIDGAEEDQFKQMKKEIESLRKELQEIKGENSRKADNEGDEDSISSQLTDQNLSRRDFLKGALGGTAAAGAMAVLPSASALDFESGSGFSFSNRSSKNFELGSSGDLNLNGGEIQNAGAANVDKISVGGDGPAESFSEIGGSLNSAGAVVKLEEGTPTAYDSQGKKLESGNDASAVIQSALNYVESGRGRGNVKIGAGSYSIQSDVKVPSNTTVCGAGIGVTVFNCTGSDQEWITKDSARERIVLRGFTQDGNDEGGRTGVNMTGVTNSRLTQLEVLNAGGRDGSSDSTPALRITGGTNSRIDNCRVRRSSSVSIEAAIGAVGCEIVNCIVEDGVYNSGAGFLHGISIEKSENCRIEGCFIEGTGSSDFSPALNVNNADYFVCANNTVRNVAQGLYNANGPCYNGVIANNNFRDCGGGVGIKSGNAGGPHGMLVKSNVFENCGIEIGDGGDADIVNNLLRNGAINVAAVDGQPAILGNIFRDVTGTVLEQRGNIGEPILVQNNYIEPFHRTDSNNEAVVIFEEQYGIMTGNSFALTQENKVTVRVSSSATPSKWIITNNYFDESKGKCLDVGVDGVVTGNIVDGGSVNVGDQNPQIYGNYSLNGGGSINPNSGASINNGGEGKWTRTGTYTGDGSTDRSIYIAKASDHVVVEAADGTLYDVHSDFGTGYQHNAPAGELSISGNSIILGDDGSDAEPNTSGESYRFYAL